MKDRASTLPLGEQSIAVLGLEALLSEKQALGRPKDRAVAEWLAELLERERGQAF